MKRRRGEFEDRVAVVTGAAQGIGRGIARAFLEKGARVALLDVQEEAVQKTLQELDREGDRTIGLGVDIGRQVLVRDAVDEIVRLWRQVHILVNNAGIQFNCASLDLTEDDLTNVIRTNLFGAFYCSQAVARASMVPHREGVIVNISSVATIVSLPRRLPYTLAKSGVNSMTRILAAEWAEYNIRVNAIAPGYIRTPLVEDAARWGHIDLEDVRSKTPAGSLGEVAQVADLTLFLASERSAFITGEIIVIDGGYTLTK